MVAPQGRRDGLVSRLLFRYLRHGVSKKKEEKGEKESRRSIRLLVRCNPKLKICILSHFPSSPFPFSCTRLEKVDRLSDVIVL